MRYDLPPREYAKALRFGAERNRTREQWWREQKDPFAPHEAAHSARQGRRLEAMAILCERSEATRAGDVDMRRLSDPTLPHEESEKIVDEILATVTK